MSIIRSLESFSLPELFKLIENNSKSGRLIIETPISNRTAKREGIYYIWFQEGHLIAISDRLNQKGLINLIAARGWLSPLIISRLRTLCPTTLPLGIYLRKMKLLDQQKLSLIFQLQLHQVYRLFQLTGGRFRFDDFSEMQDRILTIPWLEMTGHRIKTTEVTMYALRLMENWSHFTPQLPEPNLALQRIVAQPHLKLTASEHRLWDVADGKMSLLNIAKSTGQSLSIVQITAFRLISVGLVKEVFQSSYDWNGFSPQNARQSLSSSRQSQQLQKLPSSNTSLLQSLGEIFKNTIS
ncbi:MAG: DUF4388 domain-containing protein [Waterburya sp.]